MYRLTALIAAAAALLPRATAAAELPAVKNLPPTFEVKALGRTGFFYVGGKYVGEGENRVMAGQMYVEALVPKKVRQPWPLVLIHGAAQTATNWMQTPDGRKGWAHYFVEQGYVVYMIDQPARGRSPWHPNVNGGLRMFTTGAIEKQFTATEEHDLWSTSRKHTQWPGEGPGKGKAGDPVFDAFYATQVESLASSVETQNLVRDAFSALLDKVGPSIIVTHSQSGAFGWIIADARPKHVKAIVALEPAGPPFLPSKFAGGPPRVWGPTDIPLTYDPPVTDPAKDLPTFVQEKPDAPGLIACALQKEPARKLPNLAGKPVLVVAAPASYHAESDHCMVKYLQQAGVPAEYVNLEDKGIKGNAHMMMIEKNNLEIAAFLHDWMRKKVK